MGLAPPWEWGYTSDEQAHGPHRVGWLGKLRGHGRLPPGRDAGHADGDADPPGDHDGGRGDSGKAHPDGDQSGRDTGQRAGAMGTGSRGRQAMTEEELNKFRAINSAITTTVFVLMVGIWVWYAFDVRKESRLISDQLARLARGPVRGGDGA